MVLELGRSKKAAFGGIRSCAALLALAALLLAPTPARAAPDAAAWRDRYQKARATLIEGHAAEAAREFEVLAGDAPSREDADLARELASIARATERKNAPTTSGSPHIRTSDELSVLYASAFIYGLGSGSWVVLLTQPQNFALALLPFATITTAAVGGVAVADSYKPFRRGVPHSIAAGLYLGVGEGIWAIGLQRAIAARRDDGSRWGAPEVATALWGGATLGGITGGLVGALREPTPGRVSFTSSTGTWLGLSSGFLGAAFEPRDRSRTETAFVAGGAGYNFGIVSGIILAPRIAPSVARVRFMDLGAIAGGLVGAGLYAIAAEGNASERAGFGCAAAGIMTGAGFAWWLTSGMPQDPPSQATPAASLHPLFAPAAGGFIAGVTGEL